MASQIGPFLLGVHLTTVTITPLTFSGATIVPGASTSLIDVIMGLGINRENQVKDIRPLSVTNINEVPISKGYTARIRTLQLETSEVAFGVIAACTTSRFLLAWTQGGVACSGYFVLRTMPGGVPNREENELDMEFGPMAIAGASQVTYGGVPV